MNERHVPINNPCDVNVLILIKCAYGQNYANNYSWFEHYIKYEKINKNIDIHIHDLVMIAMYNIHSHTLYSVYLV